jgi:predicted transcriptional regulator
LPNNNSNSNSNNNNNKEGGTVKSMMKNRSRNDLIASILGTISRGRATRTKIMYGAFLSYTQLDKYLSLLLERNLIEYQQYEQSSSSSSSSSSASPYFKATERGLHFLRVYSQLNEMAPTIPME